MNENELKNFIETQEKRHYESLRNLFQWIIGALTIIFTAGAAIIGANIYQINNRVDNELSEAKKKVEELKLESKQYLIDAKIQSDLQIELIEKEARLQALEAVKFKVEHELQSPQIQQFIYSELRKNINKNLDDLADKSFEKASTEFRELTRQSSDLNTAFQYTLWNDVSKVRHLDSISYYSKDKHLRLIADDLLNNVRKSYTHWYGFKKDKRYSLQFRETYKETSNLNDEELLKYLIDKIWKEDDSEDITKQFYTIMDLYEKPIKLFEFHKLEQ